MDSRSDDRPKSNKLDSRNVLAFIAALVLIGAAIYLGSGQLNLVFHEAQFPAGSISLLALFVFGIFTGVHCVGMCGAFVAACSKTKTDLLLYLSSKTVSYTVVGFALGSLGTIIALSMPMRSLLAFLAGAFMILWGLNALHVKFARRIFASVPNLGIRPDSKGGPVVVGLLTGLLPCGPMLAVQAYALSTGSAVSGGLSMLAFGLGTLPLIAVFGAVVLTINSEMRNGIFQASGLLMLTMGAMMAWQSIDGMRPLFEGTQVLTNASANYSVNISALADGNYQIVNNTLDGFSYSPSTVNVEAGKPIHWIVYAKSFNYHSGFINIPSLNISRQLVLGENVIDLPALEPGAYPYLCRLNVQKGEIVVGNSG